MDTILGASSILNERNWLFFKLYKNPNSSSDWKSNLDWYHRILIDVVRPVVLSTPQIRVVFFGIYGPSPYSAEEEVYEKQISPSESNLIYIRLRFSILRGSKRHAKNAFLASISRHGNLVWDYEVMRTYHVRNDLGSRYGSNNNVQTLQFIRYWDAACRYILSILTLHGNWTQNVDVWGVPHLVNNSLGSWLRPERGPVPCPNCQTHMYMATNCTVSPALTVQISRLPYCFFICPACGHSFCRPFNI